VIIPDKTVGVELDQGYADEGVGILNIKSVYDEDGVDTASPDIPTLADPAVTLADERPARSCALSRQSGFRMMRYWTFRVRLLVPARNN
jgi:hypothetical protein